MLKKKYVYTKILIVTITELCTSDSHLFFSTLRPEARICLAGKVDDFIAAVAVVVIDDEDAVDVLVDAYLPPSLRN